MVFSETIHAMLLTHDKFRQFTPKKIADAKTSSEVLICISADSRDGVDDIVGKAKAAGGAADPSPKQDYGFMYGRSFEDPDGHIWEVMWMDVEAAAAANPPRPTPDRQSTQRNIPMSKISPCLWFDGEAEEAAKFYVSLLPDSRIENGPEEYRRRPGRQGRHRCWWSSSRWPASVSWRSTAACGWNIPTPSRSRSTAPTRPRSTGSGTRCSANGGKAEHCGWLRDRYGVSWQIVPTALTKYLGGSDAAGAQRAMQAMLGMVKLDIEGLRRAYEGKSAA